MSRYHPPITNEISHLISDAQNMTPIDLLSTYNSEVLECGQIRDITTNITYPNIKEWANAAIDENEEENVEDVGIFDISWDE